MIRSRPEGPGNLADCLGYRSRITRQATAESKKDYKALMKGAVVQPFSFAPRVAGRLGGVRVQRKERSSKFDVGGCWAGQES